MNLNFNSSISLSLVQIYEGYHLNGLHSSFLRSANCFSIFPGLTSLDRYYNTKRNQSKRIFAKNTLPHVCTAFVDVLCVFIHPDHSNTFMILQKERRNRSLWKRSAKNSFIVAYSRDVIAKSKTSMWIELAIDMSNT